VSSHAHERKLARSSISSLITTIYVVEIVNR
jgi:hypothetical protein